MDIYDLLMFQDKNEGTTPNVALVLRFFLELICEEWNEILEHMWTLNIHSCILNLNSKPHTRKHFRWLSMAFIIE